MTVVFALLAACGAAGLAFSLLGKGQPRREADFGEALRSAEGPLQDLLSRVEALEEKIAGLESEKDCAAGTPGKLPAPRRQGGARAVSNRLRSVLDASESGAGPLEIARSLGMGVAEVELALKVGRPRMAGSGL